VNGQLGKNTSGKRRITKYKLKIHFHSDIPTALFVNICKFSKILCCFIFLNMLRKMFEIQYLTADVI